MLRGLPGRGFCSEPSGGKGGRPGQPPNLFHLAGVLASQLHGKPRLITSAFWDLSWRGARPAARSASAASRRNAPSALGERFSAAAPKDPRPYIASLRAEAESRAGV